jgi:hypothetical protein
MFPQTPGRFRRCKPFPYRSRLLHHALNWQDVPGSTGNSRPRLLQAPARVFFVRVHSHNFISFD